MDAETPQTARQAPWQFSLRSLLLFTAALAGMLSAMKMLGFTFGRVRFFCSWHCSCPSGFRSSSCPPSRVGKDCGRCWHWFRLVGICCCWEVTVDGTFLLYSLVTLAFGYGLAAVALAFSARGRRHLINVPLWLALLASACALL